MLKNTASPPQTVTLEQKLIVIKHYEEGQTSTMTLCTVSLGPSTLKHLEGNVGKN